MAHGLDVALNGVPGEEERKTGKEKKIIVATIGDSTFFHTGLPAWQMPSTTAPMWS